MQGNDFGRQRLIGYSDRLSVRPKDNLTFFISVPTGHYEAEVRRLISVDGRSGAGGIKHEAVPSDVEGRHTGRVQISSIGGYASATISHVAAAAMPLTLSFAFRPSRLGRRQTLVSFNGTSAASGLRLSNGCLELVVADQIVAAMPILVHERIWYRVSLVIGAAKCRLAVSAERNAHQEPAAPIEVSMGMDAFLPKGFVGCMTLASRKLVGAACEHFTGKIGEVVVASGDVHDEEADLLVRGFASEYVLGARIFCAWSFGRDAASMHVKNEIAGGPVLTLHNLPMRAVTGPRWSGGRAHPAFAEEDYNAILFHADMVEGGDWAPSLTLTAADAWRSGVYALRIWDGVDEDWIPFYVRPTANARRARALFLAPTNTYLAYGNETNSFADIGDDLSLMKTGPVEPQDADRYVRDHPELGLSLYDLHNDGAGVAYASRLRPLLNFRPFHVNWLNGSFRHFAADFYLLDWMEHHGFDYDVITDEDLHLEGIGSLQGYSVVLTGSHPEYVSARMMNALEDYTNNGGRLMYLGGNGFYWVTSVHPTRPYLIEVRRGYTGGRNWTSPGGEVSHAFTGVEGGLWRNNGRGPHRLTGIGMGAMGWAKAAPYRRAATQSSEDNWIFDGVTEELIGQDGMMLGGAAGDEIDHVDRLHGTPPQTRVLASSVNHSKHFQPVIEEYTNMLPDQGGSDNPLVRADLTYLPTGGGGAVFSVGSICWIGCLPINNYDNAVSRITLNVLRRFIGNGSSDGRD